MIVKELIALLQECPDDAEVAVDTDEYLIPLQIVKTVVEKRAILGEKKMWAILIDETCMD